MNKSHQKSQHKMTKTPKITINYLDKNKRTILIEADKKSLLWLSKYLARATKLNKKKDDCGLDLSPYGREGNFFAKHSDLGLQIHCLPCLEGKKPIRGYSERAKRKKYYASLPTNFTSIYRRIIKLWPEEIELVARKSVGETPTTQGQGYWFPRIAKNWNQAEDVIDPFDNYGASMVWAMYQVFTQAAEELKSKKKQVLNTRRVKKGLIEAQLFNNLQGPSWSKERKRYIRK